MRSASAASAEVVAAGPVEEVHVDGIGRLDVLIDQDRDRLVLGERAQHAADRAAAVDHRVAGAPAHRLEQIVQQRIVERTRQHRHRLDLERVHERVDLPEPEVPGEQQHAAPLGVRRAHPLLPFELDAGQHLLRRSSC